MSCTLPQLRKLGRPPSKHAYFGSDTYGTRRLSALLPSSPEVQMPSFKSFFGASSNRPGQANQSVSVRIENKCRFEGHKSSVGLSVDEPITRSPVDSSQGKHDILLHHCGSADRSECSRIASLCPPNDSRPPLMETIPIKLKPSPNNAPL